LINDCSNIAIRGKSVSLSQVSLSDYDTVLTP